MNKHNNDEVSERDVSKIKHSICSRLHLLLPETTYTEFRWLPLNRYYHKYEKMNKYYIDTKSSPSNLFLPENNLKLDREKSEVRELYSYYNLHNSFPNLQQKFMCINMKDITIPMIKDKEQYDQVKYDIEVKNLLINEELKNKNKITNKLREQLEKCQLEITRINSEYRKLQKKLYNQQLKTHVTSLIKMRNKLIMQSNSIEDKIKQIEHKSNIYVNNLEMEKRRIKEQYYSKKPCIIEIFEGIYLSKLIKYNQIDTYIFDGLIKTDSGNFNMVVKFTKIYDKSSDTSPPKRLWTEILPHGPNRQQASQLLKSFDQYNQSKKQPEKRRSLLFPDFYTDNSIYNPTVYVNEAWQEIIVWSTIFTDAFYGHINVLDTSTGDIYCILFMRKYKRTLYDLKTVNLKPFYFNSDLSLSDDHVSQADKINCLKSFPKRLHAYILHNISIIGSHTKSFYKFNHMDLKTNNIVYKYTPTEIYYLCIKFKDNHKEIAALPSYNKIFEFIDHAFSFITIPMKKQSDSMSSIDSQYLRKIDDTDTLIYRNDKKVDTEKILINFCSQNPFENLDPYETMNYLNMYVDISQLAYSTLKLFYEYGIYDRYLKNDLTEEWNELMDLVVSLCLPDKVLTDKIYKPIFPETKKLLSEKGTIDDDVISSFKEDSWSKGMYSCVSELCTYGCERRQKSIVKHLSKYFIKDEKEKMKILRKYSENGYIKSQYPDFLILEVPLLDINDINEDSKNILECPNKLNQIKKLYQTERTSTLRNEYDYFMS